LINEPRYSDKTLIQRLAYFFSNIQFGYINRIVFSFVNLVLIILVPIVAYSVIFETVGSPSTYLFFLLHGKELREVQLPSNLKLPSGFQIFTKPKNKDNNISIYAEDWRGRLLGIEYPALPCEGDYKKEFESTFLVGEKPFPLINIGSVLSHYKYNNCDVYFRRTGSGTMPGGFKFIYMAHIPEKCLSIVVYDKYMNMQDCHNMLKEIAFCNIKGRYEFIEIVKEQ